jgi:hypothetical protein
VHTIFSFVLSKGPFIICARYRLVAKAERLKCAPGNQAGMYLTKRRSLVSHALRPILTYALTKRNGVDEKVAWGCRLADRMQDLLRDRDILVVGTLDVDAVCHPDNRCTKVSSDYRKQDLFAVPDMM